MIRENVLSCLPAPFLKISDLQYFKGIFFDTIHCFTQQKPFYQLKCKEKMLRLLAYILQENTQLTPKNATDEKMVTLIKDYIDQNFYNIITLEKLELQFSYNKYYIARMFRKKYAQSVMKYYHLLRIAEAKRFLAEGRSVTEISNMLNMSSIYAFSRFFKTYTGKAPSQYNTE